MDLSIDKKELKPLEKFFKDIEERLGDWTDAGPEVEALVREDYLLKFESSPSTETGGLIYGDQYWRPLEEGYLLSRSDRRGGQILVDTGELKKAYTDKNAYGSLTEITEDEMVFGVDVSIFPHAERLEQTWPLSFWHPALLEKVGTKLLEWYLKEEKR